MNLPLHYQCVLDEDGEVLQASKCLAAFQVSLLSAQSLATVCVLQCHKFTVTVMSEIIQNVFVKSGGVLKDYHKVTEIVPGERVTVRTDRGDFRARRVIITAGPRTLKIMRQLGVELPIVVRLLVKYMYNYAIGGRSVFNFHG